MNIYGSLTDIFDGKKHPILFHAPAQPRKGLFMEIQKKLFMNIYGSLMNIFD